MTTIHHPATMPSASIGLVDRVAYRFGTALVRWSSARAERHARSVLGPTTAEARMTARLRHDASVAWEGRERAATHAAAVLLPRR